MQTGIHTQEVKELMKLLREMVGVTEHGGFYVNDEHSNSMGPEKIPLTGRRAAVAATRAKHARENV